MFQRIVELYIVKVEVDLVKKVKDTIEKENLSLMVENPKLQTHNLNFQSIIHAKGKAFKGFKKERDVIKARLIIEKVAELLT